MKTFCNCCEQWTSLPVDGGKGAKVHAQCERCTAPLPVEELYSHCSNCARYYLSEYGVCPFDADLPQAEEPSQKAAAEYTTEAQRRKSRSGQYYWQLYVDYQL